MIFLERILVMLMHMLFLTAVCLGEVWYVQYDCSFRMLHPCNTSRIAAYCRIGTCSSL